MTMIWQEKLMKSQAGLNELLRCKEREDIPKKARICRQCGLPCNYEDDGYQIADEDGELDVLDFSDRRAFESVGDGVVCEECFCS